MGGPPNVSVSAACYKAGASMPALLAGDEAEDQDAALAMKALTARCGVAWSRDVSQSFRSEFLTMEYCLGAEFLNAWIGCAA